MDTRSQNFCHKFIKILKGLIILSCFILFGSLNTFVSAQISTPGKDWPMFLRDSTHTSFDFEEKILKPPLKVQWTFEPATSSATVVGKTVFVRSSNPSILYALDADFGNIKWSYPIKATSNHTCPAVVNNTVLLGNPCDNCPFEAIDINTGISKWSLSLPKGARDPNVADGVAYFGSDDRRIRAVNISTGSLIWTSKDLGDGITSVSAISGGKVFAGTWRNYIYALNINTGDVIWQFPAGGVMFSSPSIVGNTLYIGSGTQNIYALDTETGAQKWKFCCAEDSVWGSPAIAEGILYVQDLAGKIHALDANTGTLLWFYKTGAIPSSSYSSAAIANGVVYIGSQDGFIYAFDAKTGYLLWKYQTGGPIKTSPAIANNMIYVSSENGKLYAFSNVDWIPPSPIPSSSPSPLPTLTPTPTPTPVPSPKTVIVLPGLGASWNADALLNCKLESNDNEWTLAPYATDFYKPLTDALGGKHRLFNYDWRKDVRDHAPTLQNFITGFGEEKVNLVGHSMGGLVGRAYLEETKEKNQLNKLITVGSPHEGALQAYPAWAGGDLWEDNFLQKIAMTILLKRCGGLFGNDKETIRKVVPSLRNLLPTFDYLRDKRTTLLKPYQDMNIKNNWLPNNLLSSFYGVTFGILSGNNNETLKEIIIREPSNGDIKAERWLDGKPIDKIKINEGDGTVLLSSSHLAGATPFEINQNHVGLVTSSEGINQILNFFDPGTTVNVSPFSEPKSALIVIGYPSNFWILDQNKIIKDNSGIISFMNPEQNKYIFGLLPKKEDTLFIVAQFLKDGRVFWKEYNLKNRLPKFGLVDFDPENPQEDPLKLLP